MILLLIALACSSYAETAQCWAPLRIGLKGLNAFCWGRVSTDHSLHALWRGPLAFVSPNNDGTVAPRPERDLCSVQPMGGQQLHVYVKVWVSVHMSLYVHGNAKVNTCGVNVSFTPSFCIYSMTKGRATSHKERANQTLAVWIYARVFRLVRL